MRRGENGSVVFESRTEVDILWDILENAYAGKLRDDERETVKDACRILEAMSYEW